MKQNIIISLCALCFLFLYAQPAQVWGSDRQYTISGKTMGTFYNIKFISDNDISTDAWEKKIEVCLKDINKKMSMFDPESELSRFNRHKIQENIHISRDFFSVLVTAQTLHKITNGAWDGTIKPLVDLWGFGTKKTRNTVPEQTEILAALSHTGFNHIRLVPPNIIQKTRPLTLDLGSIAKGYGVDKIAGLFLSSGIKDILVEIGGELYASGKNKKGKPWAVGISRPEKDISGQDLYTVLKLRSQSIATSGDYRNFFKKQGRAYSHIIDPKTGFPVKTRTVSASVISKTCTFADGLATALMIMDVQTGLDLVNRLADTECLIITNEEKGFVSHMSKNFNQLVMIPSH